MQQPTIEIVRTPNGRFSFAVEIGEGGGWYVRDGLVSIAACVQKAAAALGPEFKFAQIAYGHLGAAEVRGAPPPRALLAASAPIQGRPRYW